MQLTVNITEEAYKTLQGIAEADLCDTEYLVCELIAQCIGDGIGDACRVMEIESE